MRDYAQARTPSPTRYTLEESLAQARGRVLAAARLVIDFPDHIFLTALRARIAELDELNALIVQKGSKGGRPLLTTTRGIRRNRAALVPDLEEPPNEQ